jgi:2',3'-cyclic-nucleotide 2'-phosphodiesterase (5'-nucleotidase family)
MKRTHYWTAQSFICRLLCALVGMVLVHSGPLAAETHTLTILHTNDTQGRRVPAAYYEEAGRGGWARLAHLLREVASDPFRAHPGRR